MQVVLRGSRTGLKSILHLWPSLVSLHSQPVLPPDSFLTLFGPQPLPAVTSVDSTLSRSTLISHLLLLASRLPAVSGLWGSISQIVPWLLGA